MTNQHLIETHLASLRHYEGEVDKHEEAIRTARKAQKDICNLLKETIPWTEGTILLCGNRVRKFCRVDEVRLNSGVPYFITVFWLPENDGWCHNVVKKTVELTEISEWVIVNPPKEK